MWRHALDLVDGLRYVRGRRLLWTLVTALTLVELGSVAPLNIGLLLLANRNGWGPSGAGWLLGAFGVGAGAGALLLAATGRVPFPGAVYIASLAAGAAAIGCFGLVPSLPVATAVGALAGLLLGLNGGLAYALVQSATEPAYLGRVMALLSLASFGVGPLTYPVFGAVVVILGPAPVFAIFGGICALGAVVCLVSRQVRGAELPR
jgi:MFS family permease